VIECLPPGVRPLVLPEGEGSALLDYYDYNYSRLFSGLAVENGELVLHAR
jgi:hypothetical protein